MRLLSVLFYCFISVLCLLFIFLKMDVKAAVNVFSTIDYRWLFIASLACILKPWIHAVRWYCFMSTFKSGFSLASCFRYYSIGTLLNITIPFRLGDLARTRLMAKELSVPNSMVLGSVACEHFLDLLTLCFLIMCCFAFHLYFFESRIILIASIFIAITLIIFSLLFLLRNNVRLLPSLKDLISKKFSLKLTILTNFYSGFFQFGGLNKVIKILTVTTMIWILQGVWIYSLLCSLGITSQYQFECIEVIVLMVIMASVVMVPASPGYIGTFHIMVMMGLVQLGVPKSLSLSYAILAHAHSLIMIALVGLYSYFRSDIKLFDRSLSNRLLSYKEAI